MKKEYKVTDSGTGLSFTVQVVERVSEKASIVESFSFTRQEFINWFEDFEAFHKNFNIKIEVGE
jgi:hypothetical protein